MMPEHLRLGALGEHKAAVYLRENGYILLAGNYRTSAGEIDIIAENDNNLCFIEVKTRKKGGMFPPSDAVDSLKEENVRSAAAYYRSKYEFGKLDRFDIIEVVVDTDGSCGINHIKNAF